jgi:hypothetical protein
MDDLLSDNYNEVVYTASGISFVAGKALGLLGSSDSSGCSDSSVGLNAASAADTGRQRPCFCSRVLVVQHLLRPILFLFFH